MKGMLSILIAYDGSGCADAALDDLRRAGLPRALEAVIVTVADVLLPPPDAKVAVDELPARALESVWHTQARAEQAVKEARVVAERAAHVSKPTSRVGSCGVSVRRFTGLGNQ